MISENNLPPEYVPFDRLNVCGNAFNNGRLLFTIDGHVPLLVGKGPAEPKVWLAMPLHTGSDVWLPLVREGESRHPSIEVRLLPGSAVRVLADAKTTIINVRKTGATTATIDSLDLRPIGLTIYGDESGLFVGGTRIERNTFENVGVMVGIGPQLSTAPTAR